MSIFFYFEVVVDYKNNKECMVYLTSVRLVSVENAI